MTTPTPESIRSGDARAIARAATLIENRDPAGQALLRALFPFTGRALVAGLTGPPGAGKSTLVSALAAEFRLRGLRVAILAVDPSSPFSGGAILGDRVRMMAHHGDSGVFIRSMATRGRLGGLAPATGDLSLLCDAAGFDVVLIETVGVGQDEIDIARLAGVNAVVLVPGMGDGIQALKAGILETASLFAINKSDRPGARELAAELHAEAPEIPVFHTIATEPPASPGAGIRELAAAILNARPTAARRTLLWRWRLREMLLERLASRIDDARLAAAAGQVASGARDPYGIVEEWTAG